MNESLALGAQEGRLLMELRNFFQLHVSVAELKNANVVFTLFRNGVSVDSFASRVGRDSFNLSSYGSYSVSAEFIENGSKKKISSKPFKFDGFGADPNEKIKKNIAILGVSRLALVVEELLKISIDANVTFFSSNSKHIGAPFGGGIIKEFDKAEFSDFDRWILMNGISADVTRQLESVGMDFGVLSANSTAPLDEYLNLIPVSQLHSLAHSYHLENLDIGADFVVRFIRKRFGSVLPATVDLSGARFAYGCISTVINKNAVIGNDVTIGQNVTIGGRNGRDPVLEDGVWIGAGAVVLGARIGANSTIGANAVVTKDLEPGSVVVAPRNRLLDR